MISSICYTYLFVMFFAIPQVALESLPLGCILETKAVLDSCAYNSLLTITVQERNRGPPQVYMFQCEEVGVSQILLQPRPSYTFHQDTPLPSETLPHQTEP